MIKVGIQEFNEVYKLEEFLKFEEKSEVPLEFINGEIYPKSFISINHNRIVNRINAKIDEYLGEKPCMVLSEQIEVGLGEDRVKSDIFVVCKIIEINVREWGRYLLQN